MPGLNGTGPLGVGPMTGGGFGFCPHWIDPRYGFYPVYGVGRGGFPWGGGRGRTWGGGRGRYWRRAFTFYGPPYYPGVPYAEPSPEDELSFLKNQAVTLEKELTDIRDRIQDLEKELKQKPEK